MFILPFFINAKNEELGTEDLLMGHYAVIKTLCRLLVNKGKYHAILQGFHA